MSKLYCPGPCDRKRRVNQLLCRECWDRLAKVPRGRSIRSDLFVSWSAAYRDLSSDLLWSKYMQARRVALRALR